LEKYDQFTSSLPTETVGGQYRFREFLKLWFDKNLRTPEIRKIFTTVDINKDNIVDDTEWSHFFDNYLDPFQKCDKDKNFAISVEEFKACLTESTPKFD